mmetsp:Transcript_23598/g.50196  ORF Transcript_23598/g.50196 Transcript_23598/m.50196 type:complete len:81 (-) Transcript_23598:148-390(-)|eukprot:CAMPEP_0201237374 /NCGR_PEP_ID=MMETSP0852-20130820/9327_1 /ASSEMBLY_ACC=CAM_ASM_000632 /TAXON_ID=183588 /ORGANISM="Pseudo-nitzschia fraudulenta, Strain WWA7" /LENGTH=80 /DNA_ID=CAMNT_0047531573 /DNA_START=87 /DNA_END=329 /DNA_ORIENTATION=-
MSEVVGATELAEMEAEVKLLQAKFAMVKEAEELSKTCSRIATSVQASSTDDAFLTTEASPPNPFHTSAGSGGESGCCVVS